MKSVTLSSVELSAIIANAVAQAMNGLTLPQTSAKVETKVLPVAALRPVAVRPVVAKKASETDDGEISFLYSDAKQRPRFPRRMFAANGICNVDGIKYGVDDTEGNGGRSKKLNLATLFGAAIGQTVSFVKVQKGKYDVVLSGKGKVTASAPQVETPKRPTVAKLVQVVAAIAKPAKPARPSKVVEIAAKLVPDAPKAAKRIETVDEFLDTFEKYALAGFAAKRDDSAKLIKIAGMEADARCFLSTSQRIVFKGVRKSLGLTHKASVEMLNERVYA